VSARREEPLANTRFVVNLDGVGTTPVAAVVFPEARLVTGTDGRHTPQFGPLTLTRAAVPDSDWLDWWTKTRRAAEKTFRDVSVVLLDGDGTPAAVWMIRKARPVAYQLSPLNAMGHDVVTETLELSIEDFGAVPISR
jgi:phage tail-like protein